MKEISKFLTDESMICFVDGTVVKGAEEVSNVLIECCKSYNAGYIQGVLRATGYGVIVGAGIAGAVLYTRKIIKNKKDKGKA